MVSWLEHEENSFDLLLPDINSGVILKVANLFYSFQVWSQ